MLVTAQRATQASPLRVPRTDDRTPRTDDRTPRTDDRTPRTEDRAPRDRGLRIVMVTVFIAAAAVLASGCQLSEPYRTVSGGNAKRGEAALENYGCGSCHVIPGVRNAVGMVGPPLNWFGRRTVIAGEVANTPDELIAWIMDPQHIEPATVMPNLGVTAADARDMAAYLYRLH